MEICKNKTVLIITHNTEILPYVDETIDIGMAKKGHYNINSENEKPFDETFETKPNEEDIDNIVLTEENKEIILKKLKALAEEES